MRYFTDEPTSRNLCQQRLDAKQGDCHIVVLCTRPRNHRNTGHEFVGTIGCQHMHIIWGEPTELCS